MIIISIICFIILLVIFNPAPFRGDWSTASRESANLVLSPHINTDAQVYIFSAKAFAWRGKFSVHTWIATKEKNADNFLTYNVLMWANYFGADGVVLVQKDLPDRFWYGSAPKIIFSATGQKAEKMIPEIYAASSSYPYQKLYRAYPGPNSNTFISYIMREVQGFNISLPSNAIGKDWLCGKTNLEKKFFAISESKTGLQFSLYGMLGIIVGVIDGIEINIIGLSFGIDFLRPALKLPIVGRVGFAK